MAAAEPPERREPPKNPVPTNPATPGQGVVDPAQQMLEDAREHARRQAEADASEPSTPVDEDDDEDATPPRP